MSPFELQPTLVGEHIRLRPLQADDFEALYAVASDPLIWEQHPASDRYQRPVFEAFFAMAMESGGAFLALNTAGEVIGSSRYCNLVTAESVVEIGYTFLARSYWGGTMNGEMKRLMIDHAFQFVDRVVFRIGAQNMRSRRAVEKIGGVLIGTQTANGLEGVTYAIERTDWTP